MNFGQFFSILRARWWVAALIFVLAVGVTAGVSFMLPKQYTASASVVIDVKPDPVSAIMYAGMASPAFMATQVDIIKSDRVAQRVVRDLKLADNPQVRQQWLDATQGQGSIEVWLGEMFQASLDVKPSRESNVITVGYKAQDPRFAAGLSNAFVQAYIATSLELRVDPAKRYTSFFDAQSKEAREALEKAQARLSDFQREKGIIATDERLDIETSRLNELSSQLVAIQAVAAESNSRQAQAGSASADRMQEVLSNPIISGLKTDLSRQEARLKELNARLGDAHPQVVELKANIAELRVKIAEETSRVTGGVGVTSAINRSREAQVRAALDSQRSKVLGLKQVRDEGLVLSREVENAQRAYDALMTRFNQTSLESQTTQSNVNLLTPATAPLHPSSPSIRLNVLVAVFLGTLTGIGAALALEFLDRRVRGLADIPGALDLPVIGIMPGPTSKRLFRSDRVRLAEQRMIGRLAAPVSRA
jgi:chain length determinant protein EpsF